MGVQNQPFLAANQWQAQVSYQYADANDFYVGDQRNDAAAPSGFPPHRKVNLINVDVIYGLSNRLSMDLTVPFGIGSGAVDARSGCVAHRSYEFDAAGLGDVSLQAEYWLSDPDDTLARQWIRGPGHQGADRIRPRRGDGWARRPETSGRRSTRPISWAPEAGSVLLRAQGTAQIEGPLFAYGSGYYGLSLTRSIPTSSNARRASWRTPTHTRGVWARPISCRPRSSRVSSSRLGGRINGVTVKDLIGGGDLYWRRPGYEIYVEPGLTWTLGREHGLRQRSGQGVRRTSWTARSTCRSNRHGRRVVRSYLFLASFARRF